MKRLLVLFVVLFTVFFSYTIIAQEMGAVRKGLAMSFPEKVLTPLGPPLAAGTYTVGTGGNFPTIDSAFKKLSADGVAGAVTLELINTLYVAPTDTFGFKLVGPIPGAGPSSRVTIKPAVNKNVVVEGVGGTTFYLLNTSYVTFDGVSLTGATTLTIHTLKNAAYLYNDGIDLLNNSDHNLMQNIIFINEDTNYGSSGCYSLLNSTTAPDSNLIQNNLFKKGGYGVYVSAYNTNLRAVGNIIRGNKIGSEVDSLLGWGIQVEKTQNTIIENNIVQNIKVTPTSGEILLVGINSYAGLGDIIRNNIVHNIKPSAGYTSTGILLSGGTTGGSGNNNQVYNNMVYNIQSTSTAGDSRVAGIQMWYQSNPKIYYNTVYLSGTGSNNLGSAALYTHEWGNCFNIDVRNNILINTRNESPHCASSIWINPGTTIATSNFNDLYYSPSIYNCTVKMYGDNYNTLADWQATGKDLNSVTEMPNLIAPYLHINAAIPTYLEKGATPIAGITTDFDGQPRNATKPDIGADEFDGLIVPVELTSFTVSAFGNEVTLNWSTATELNNQGFEIQRKALGGEFATVAFVKGQGTTTQQNRYSFADKNLDEGKYSYRLKQVDFSGTFEYSKIIEVEVVTVEFYSLEQNYPNPFNPSTTISYGLKEKSNAKLVVFNTIGEEIAVLVNEEQDKGYHKVEFDGAKLSSGVYFYKLTAGNFISTRKMLVLK